jgi:hypothetical protein
MDTEQLMETLKQPLWQQYISVALMLYPAIRLCRRAGLSPLFALLLLIPYAGLLLAAAAIAFRPWPNVHPAPKREKRT